MEYPSPQGGWVLSSIAIACIAFACASAGRCSVCFSNILPEHHLSADTKGVVKLGIALIATMAALVLGLLIASAKSTYDTGRSQLLQVSADVILLDRLLAYYGPETKEARALLQRSVTVALEQLWPENGGQAAKHRSKDILGRGSV